MANTIYAVDKKRAQSERMNFPCMFCVRQILHKGEHYFIFELRFNNVINKTYCHERCYSDQTLGGPTQ